MAVRVRPNRAEQVQACLARVMDPELDESVTELGFLTDIELSDEGDVRIAFRLPTYWCAANFAFLMADDMRRAVRGLPWVRQVQVRLQDHMYAQAINQGVAEGAGFQAAFGVAAEGGLEALRLTFQRKAFQRRQAALIDHLLDTGLEAAAIAALDLSALRQLELDADGERLAERYLDCRGLVGGEPSAWVDLEGHAIDASALPAHLRLLRRVGVNAEFNGALCRGLLAVRDQAGGDVQPIVFVPREPPRPSAT